MIAAFRSNTDAEAAATDLQEAGIPRDDIYIEGNYTSGKPSRSQTKPTEGGIKGWFKSVFGEEDDPDRSQYENAVTSGDYLLRVDVDEDEIGTVEDILNRHSPVDVHAGQVEQQTGARAEARETRGTNAIPVVKEEIQVGKRQVLRGGVRVYSRVIEEPVEEKITLREERVRVDRQPANRAATQSDLAGDREQVVEVQEFAEEPVVSKQSRVVEEVRVGKDVSERTETVRDTLRHTEVNVEKNPGSDGGKFDDSDFRADFQNRYAFTGASYDTYQPAYRYGYDMASDPRYQGRSFDEVEPDLRKDYGRRYPNSAWENTKEAIRSGWNKVTGKAHATTAR